MYGAMSTTADYINLIEELVMKLKNEIKEHNAGT
jgi:hypothetical protein